MRQKIIDISAKFAALHKVAAYYERTLRGRSPFSPFVRNFLPAPWPPRVTRTESGDIFKSSPFIWELYSLIIYHNNLCLSPKTMLDSLISCFFLN